ncbi:hypothetical protein [Comamonas terrigena]|jgi:hypothetical protein|uniref:hypothetical protein n=1 Tax=Comamonas terrigena TaxID=32013 RepID=UPI001B6DE644|nr:hypothetical protein [Comamonas terrigena]MBP7351498.1 hypothetical protein [Comamonas sp.]MDH0050910.1 hypothetical protein [Comamonas terrigena]MDH0513254.1 hypothetical protein [Comamonas terrigena]MDH1092700.1 hypothetical protein [Comamonas terrigena]MDH1292764.1 hypothetical protein [Comamonas terrigena]
MRRCIIKVEGAYYTALFPSTCAALEDAMRRFPRASAISVRTVQRLYRCMATVH